jgi:hypothetical protein
LSDVKRGPPLVLIVEVAVTVLTVILDYLRKQGRRQG